MQPGQTAQGSVPAPLPPLHLSLPALELGIKKLTSVIPTAQNLAGSWGGVGRKLGREAE